MILTDAEQKLRQRTSYRLVLKGATDVGVSADVTVDARHGDMQGTVTEGDATGEIIVAQDHLYIQGLSLANQIQHIALDPSLAGRWIRMPGPLSLLEMLRRPPRLAQCLQAESGVVRVEGPTEFAGRSAVLVASGADAQYQGRITVAADTSPDLLRWQIDANSHYPLECAISVDAVGTGFIGDIQFSNLDAAAAVVAPVGPYVIPDPDQG